MYRVAAEETAEPEEAIPLPVESLASWLTIALLAVIGVAVGGGLIAARMRLLEDADAQPPLRGRAVAAPLAR